MERWLAVPGFEGYYEVSSLGRVRSVDRVIMRRDGRPNRVRGRVLQTGTKPPGDYLVVNLRREGTAKTCSVHVLVCEAFHGPRPPGKNALHRNDVETDNWAENLYWGTQSQNMQDRVRNGGDNHSNQECCVWGHLLIAPNLVASLLKQGRRGCLACARARAAVGSVLQERFRLVADQKYAEIMSHAVQPLATGPKG